MCHGDGDAEEKEEEEEATRPRDPSIGSKFNGTHERSDVLPDFVLLIKGHEFAFKSCVSLRYFQFHLVNFGCVKDKHF